MTKPLRWTLIAVALLVATGVAGLAGLVGVWLATDRNAAITEASDLRYTDVQRVLDIARTHDPRRATPGQLTAVALTERDLDLLLNHAAHRALGARMRVQVERGSATLLISHQWPGRAWGRWVNVELRWLETAGLPRVQSWRVGSLPLPAALATPLMRMALARAFPGADLTVLGDAARQYNHLTIANELRQRVPGAAHVAEELASHYGVARYRSPAEPIAPETIRDARLALCRLAGVRP